MKRKALGEWFRNTRFAQGVYIWLKAGTSPEKLACSLALGFVLGVFPVFGVPTILCTVAAAVWGLNFPALQLVNYLVYPLQIALLWPFVRFGATLFGAVYHSNSWRTLAGFLAMALHATAAWFCFAVPAGLLLYFVLRRFLQWHRAISLT